MQTICDSSALTNNTITHNRRNARDRVDAGLDFTDDHSMRVYDTIKIRDATVGEW
jgi:hypothetical protein